MSKDWKPWSEQDTALCRSSSGQEELPGTLVRFSLTNDMMKAQCNAACSLNFQFPQSLSKLDNATGQHLQSIKPCIFSYATDCIAETPKNWGMRTGRMRTGMRADLSDTPKFPTREKNGQGYTRTHTWALSDTGLWKQHEPAVPAKSVPNTFGLNSINLVKLVVIFKTHQGDILCMGAGEVLALHIYL